MEFWHEVLKPTLQIFLPRGYLSSDGFYYFSDEHYFYSLRWLRPPGQLFDISAVLILSLLHFSFRKLHSRLRFQRSQPQGGDSKWETAGWRSGRLCRRRWRWRTVWTTPLATSTSSTMRAERLSLTDTGGVMFVDTHRIILFIGNFTPSIWNKAWMTLIRPSEDSS